MTPLIESIPLGLCQCGCGQKTTYIRGVYRRFLKNHNHVIRPLIENALHFKIDEEYCRFIPLTRGLIAIVNEGDYERLMFWKWYAFIQKSTNCVYAARSSGRRTIFMHSLLCETGPGEDVDHRNRNSLDNRRSNLRPASRGENNHNSKLRADNTSGYKGVYKNNGRWCGRVTKNGVNINLGVYDTPELAHAARIKAIREFFGEFATDL